MRSGLQGGLLNRVAASILALAQGLLSRVSAFIRGKRKVKTDEVMNVLREAFDGPYCKLLAEAMSDVTGRRVTPAEVRRMVIGDVSLSSRLYHQSRQTAALVRRVVADFDRYGGDARKLALALFEGYGFRDREIINPRVRLPTYMNNAALNVEMDALYARIQAMSLKNDALRASYLQALDAILSGKGQDAINKAMEVAVQERYRYFANRIAQTELVRAQNIELAREIMADKWVELVRFRLTDGHVEDICDLFALVDRYGLGPGVYPKALAPLPPLHPHCLPGDTLITASGMVTAVSKRWFDGDVAIITTASGKRLTATINHPVLTPCGWVGAGLINVGDQVVSRVACVGVEGTVGRIDEQHQDVPTSISEITDSFFAARKMTAMEVEVSAEDFHGDGMTGQIAVIGADRELWDRMNPAAFEVRLDHQFKTAYAAVARLFCKRILNLLSEAARRSTNGIMRCSCLLGPLLAGHSRRSNQLLLAGCSRLDAVTLQGSGDRVAHDAKLICQLKDAGAGNVALNDFILESAGDQRSSMRRRPSDDFDIGLFESFAKDFSIDSDLASEICHGSTGPVLFDDVVNIERKRYSGHVYNLETVQGHYTGNGIITHNCKCVVHGWAGSADGAQSNSDAIAAFLSGLDERTAARIAGSRTKLDAVLKGADFLDLINAGRPERYRIAKLGDVE